MEPAEGEAEAEGEGEGEGEGEEDAELQAALAMSRGEDVKSGGVAPEERCQLCGDHKTNSTNPILICDGCDLRM